MTELETQFVTGISPGVGELDSTGGCCSNLYKEVGPAPSICKLGVADDPGTVPSINVGPVTP